MAASAAVAPGQQYPIHAVGDLVAAFLDVTLSGNYAAGGDSLDLTQHMKKAGTPGKVFLVLVSGKAGYSFDYDYTNKKLVVRQVGAETTHTHTENTAAAYTQNAVTVAGGARAAAPDEELSAGAYPAALTSGTIRILAMGK